MSGARDDLFSNNNAILLPQDVSSQTCVPAPTLPGLGGERWVAEVRDRKSQLQEGHIPAQDS